MAERTIRISNLPEGTTENKIRQTLDDVRIARVFIRNDEAFVEFETIEDLEVLEFGTENGEINKL